MEKAISGDAEKQVPLKNGKTLVLRRPRTEDAQAMLGYIAAVGGESDNLLFGEDGFSLTEAQERAYIERMNADENSLMLLGFIDGALVSISQISGSGRPRTAHNSELAISVRKAHWGVGVGGAAMRALIRYAQQHPRIRVIFLGVRRGNENAVALYEKCGFKHIGVRKDFFCIRGEYHDQIMMDLHLAKQV